MRLLLPLALFVGPLALTPSASAQQRDHALPRLSPSASLSQTVGTTEVTITYGRPAVRGRAVFGPTGAGALVPYGDVWRTGADEATTITFSTDVEVEERPLAAGTYGLFTVPGPRAWTLVFNGVPEQWGAYSYDAAQDVLRVDVTPEAAPPTERLTFSADSVGLDHATFALRWADVRVPFRVRADADALVRARATEEVGAATDWRVPLRYADWAWRAERLLDDAAGWASRAVELEPGYPTYATQARVAAARGDYAAAAAAGERAVAAARAMEEPPGNLASFEAALADWRAR